MVESFENLYTILRDWGKIRYKKVLSLVKALNMYESLKEERKAVSSLENDLEKVLPQSQLSVEQVNQTQNWS